MFGHLGGVIRLESIISRSADNSAGSSYGSLKLGNLEIVNFTHPVGVHRAHFLSGEHSANFGARKSIQSAAPKNPKLISPVEASMRFMSEFTSSVHCCAIY